MKWTPGTFGARKKRIFEMVRVILIQKERVWGFQKHFTKDIQQLSTEQIIYWQLMG